MNLADLFFRTAAKYTTRVAVDKGLQAVTYLQLESDIRAMAAQLDQLGVQRESCVGLHVQSGYEYIVSVYAVWTCRASVAPIAVELSPLEKLEVQSQLGITHILEADTPR